VAKKKFVKVKITGPGVEFEGRKIEPGIEISVPVETASTLINLEVAVETGRKEVTDDTGTDSTEI
jgi:hypothetical protein